MRQECPHCGSSTGYQEYERSAWCFKCHKLTWLKRDDDYIAPVRVKQIFEGLPMNSTHTLPATAIAWLKKYNVTDEQIDLYRFMYAREIDNHGKVYKERLIIPSYDKHGNLRSFQARALLPNDDTKYISSGDLSYMFWSRQVETEVLCIVEDAISAVRVGEVISCVALGGTNVNDEKLYKLIKQNRPLVVWLDGDKPGQAASRKLINRLGPLAKGGVKSVISSKDPKAYTVDEIKELARSLRVTKDQYVFRI